MSRNYLNGKVEKMMKGLKRRIRKSAASSMAVLMTLLTLAGTFQNGMITAEAATPSVVYQAHSSGLGWLGDVSNGATAGTEGQSRAVECVTIEVKGMSGGIRYRVHMAEKGWSDWVYDDRPCGTTGEGRRTEAIEIQLTGEIAKHYDVEYRTHCQNVGWTSWQRSGVAGTTGQSLRMEAFQVRLVKKASANNNTTTTTTGSTTMSSALYGTSGGKITCGFDGYTSINGRHEGVDLKKGQDAKVYSLTDGVITRVSEGAEGSEGLSTIAIYNQAANKTVVYLHSNPVNSLKAGQTVKRGQQIATESWRGCAKAKDAHTHVEVRNGKQTGAAKSVGDSKLDNPNPNSFWKSQGYTVK